MGVDGEALEGAETSTCLSSIIDELGGTGADVKVSIDTTRAEEQTDLTVRMFATTVKPELLHGAETWS